jgi:GH18 family chitinase
MQIDQYLLLLLKVFSFLSEEHYKSVDIATVCETTTHLVISPLEPSEDGNLLRMMQYPDETLLNDARSHGCEILLGFGANYHSGSFAKMLLKPEARGVFLSELSSLVKTRNIIGIDYFSHEVDDSKSDEHDNTSFYVALQHLVHETRHLFGDSFILSVSYFPIGDQEKVISEMNLPQIVDFLHIMAFDMPGEHHASAEVLNNAVEKAIKNKLPLAKMTMGLPLFGRHSKTHDRVPYEQITRSYNPIDHAVDIVLAKARVRIDVPTIKFNGRDTIMLKTTYAGQIGFAGVSVWEAGYDCRVNTVVHEDATYEANCPDGRSSSMFVFIGNAEFAVRAIKKNEEKIKKEEAEKEAKTGPVDDIQGEIAEEEEGNSEL